MPSLSLKQFDPEFEFLGVVGDRSYFLRGGDVVPVARLEAHVLHGEPSSDFVRGMVESKAAAHKFGFSPILFRN
jgi:hypothetical protein